MSDQIQRLSKQGLKLLILYLVAWHVMSCIKSDAFTIECRKFELGLISKDYNVLKSEISSLAADLLPDPTPTDPLGHADNLSILVDRLNSRCKEMQVSMSCYACIYTLPALSEIVIELDSAGIPIDRTIDIATPDDEVLEFRAVH